MEGNAKSPLQWDWENLIMFNAKTTEYPKKLRSSDWVIDAEGSLDFGCFYSSTGVGAGSCSDVGHVSSKCSKSASMNSSSAGEIKISKFAVKAFEDIPDNFINKKGYTACHVTGSSPTFEAPVSSGEPLLGLKLGKRMYFEDVCAGSNSKTPVSVVPLSSETQPKKSKINCLSTHTQRCQVEGCNLDLSTAKSYHRKHKICESHSKCPKVIVGGQERRFCQQCSRFHGLSEFDEKKRSCRRRLTDHNARRRKPQPEAVRLNQGRLSSSFNDMRQQMDLVMNGAPIFQARADATLPWESTCGSTFTITKGYPYKSTKAGAEGQLHFASNQLSAPVTKISHDNTNRLLTTKVTTTEILQGFEESISSNMETAQDLHRALSLLSTNTWSSTEPKAHSSHTSLPQPAATYPNTTPRDSEYWHTTQQEMESTKSRVHAAALSSSPSDGSFQEFRLLRSPYDAVFYPNELN